MLLFHHNCRIIRDKFSSKHRIALLFAKHKKLKEHVAFLSRTPTPVVVGTPNRLSALLTASALKLDSTAVIVFDMWRNPKNVSVFDEKQVSLDLMKLYQDHLARQIDKRNSELKICLY